MADAGPRDDHFAHAVLADDARHILEMAEHGFNARSGRAIADEAHDLIAQLGSLADLGFDKLCLLAVADDQHALQVSPASMRIAQVSVQDQPRKPHQHDREERPVDQH